MRNRKIRLLMQIFWTFLKIGPVTFGGGYAMIPLIEREVVRKRHWIAEQDMQDIFAVAGSVPGAIAINSATFIGYRLAGVTGAVTATIGVLLPTFSIVLLLSIFFLQVQDHPIIDAAFVSIRATIVALIAYAAYRFGKTSIVDKTTAAVIVAAVIMLYFLHVHPVLMIAVGGIAGIVLVYIRGKLGLRTKLEHESKENERAPDYFMGDGI